MLFPTVTFACFFLVVYWVNYLLVSFDRTRRVFLLLASYVFYSTWNVNFLPLLLGCTFTNYLFGLLLGRTSKNKYQKWILTFGIALNLSVLGLFKYYNFFVSSFINLGNLFRFKLPIPILELTLPLGISFFTFQGISYLVDIYKEKITPEKSPLNVLLFVSFFPHLVSGPIVRAADFIPQLKKSVNPTTEDIHKALLLILSGLFKKLILANYLGTHLVDPVFQSPETYSSLDILLAVYGYAIQIFCDFSAYSDMAIALAALLGYQFPKNFDQPYRAHSLQDFWRRWHISLSSWLRDYLFIPLGGSREGKFKTYRNLFLTMLLGGIWHGASWTYVFWGILHGTGLAIEHWKRETQGEHCDCAPSQVWSTFWVFHFVCFGWIFFRCDSFSKSMSVLKAFGNIMIPDQKLTPFTLALLLIGASLQFLPKQGLEKISNWLTRIPTTAVGLLAGIVLAILSVISPDEISPFIYFGF